MSKKPKSNERRVVSTKMKKGSPHPTIMRLLMPPTSCSYFKL